MMIGKQYSIVLIAIVLLLLPVFINQPIYTQLHAQSMLSPVAKIYLPINRTPYLIFRITVWRDTNKNGDYDEGEELPGQLVKIRSGNSMILQITNSQGSSIFIFGSGVWDIDVCGITYQFDATVYRFVPGLIILQCS